MAEKKATLAQAKALGFDSNKGITVKDGMFVFDKSLAPERSGFQSVGVAKPGEEQMTPYYGDVTGAYRLNQSQYAQARASGDVSKAQLDIMRQNEIDALVAQGSSKEEAAKKVDATGGYGTSGGGVGGSASGSLTGTGGPGTPEQQAARKSAYDLLVEEFTRYGLGALVEPLKGLVMDNVSPSEFSLRLQQTDAYKKRFSANADRIAKGLTALKPAEYLAMEDSYQNIMRNYGLPASYYSRDSLGTQAGFNQLLANDVSATELEDRVMTAQNRVVNANPEVYKALKAFYPDITNGDILAYTLDPTKALDAIKRKVTAAEIGGAALASGLTTEAATAENLARYGVTKQQAEQGYQAIGGMLPRASQLADIYRQDPYTQAVAESEVFGTGNAVSAAERRKKLTSLETAKFSGSSGMAGNALSRDRALSSGVYRESGAGSF
jgi:hypothetical protein